VWLAFVGGGGGGGKEGLGTQHLKCVQKVGGGGHFV